jgi:hypothetical protein
MHLMLLPLDSNGVECNHCHLFHSLFDFETYNRLLRSLFDNQIWPAINLNGAFATKTKADAARQHSNVRGGLSSQLPASLHENRTTEPNRRHGRNLAQVSLWLRTSPAPLIACFFCSFLPL